MARAVSGQVLGLVQEFLADDRLDGERVEAGDAEKYPNLQLILRRSINWDLIRQQYDEMIKVATGLRLGTAETDNNFSGRRLDDGA